MTSRSRTPPTLQCSLPAIRSRSCFTYLANFLHIQRLVSSALRSSSTQRRLPINYSSSPIGFNSRIVDGILVALTSFFSVVHSAAFSFSGLALCLLHSEARPVRTPHVLLPLTPGLVPTSRIESHCFTRPRFQLGLSSRARQDSTKRARSTRSTRSGLEPITMYSTLQVLQWGHFSRCARPPPPPPENCSPAFNSAFNMKVNFIDLCIGPTSTGFGTRSELSRNLPTLASTRLTIGTGECGLRKLG